MKYVLFVEGHTEKKAVPDFLKRWLDKKINPHAGLDVVRFEGWPELIKDSPKKAGLYLEKNDVMAVIALLDLYGPAIYPPQKTGVNERYEWAKNGLEKKVGNPRFFQFFAVHEVEAWLLSDPSVFPQEIRNSFNKKIAQPETVNFDEPPGELLNRLYLAKTEHRYKKVVQGQQLFKKLDPFIAYNKCPYLKRLLDKMLEIASGNGFTIVN
jgi:hypothetical protein